MQEESTMQGSEHAVAENSLGPEPSSAADRATQHARHRNATFPEYLESLLVTVLLALFGTTFLVQAFKIPSSSMEHTLLVGDHLLVNKFVFGGTGAWYDKLLPYRPLQRGDIIVFKYPYADHQHFVKRVIGVPGDRVKVVDQEVYVNGKLQVEPYVVHDSTVPIDPWSYSFPPPSRQFVTSSIADAPEVAKWKQEVHKYVQGGELV